MPSRSHLLRAACAGLLITGCSGASPAGMPSRSVLIPRVEASSAPPSPAPAPAPRAAEGRTARRAQGVFVSEIWSTGAMQEAETDLDLTDQGGRGSYTFTHDERRIRGELGLCRLSGVDQWTCQWLDEFGTGKVTFRLDAALTRFEGEWWVDEDPTQRYPWNGRRLGADVEEQPADRAPPSP